MSYQKATDVNWIGWMTTGLFYSLSMLPYVLLYTQNYMGFIYRLVIVTVFTTIWSESIGKDWLEEGGRGAVIIATLPLLT